MSEYAVTSRFADRQRDERITGNVLPPAGTAAGMVLTANADGTSSWQAAGGGTTITYGTTLPAGPSDGAVAVLVDSLTLPTFSWMFRFNNGSLNTDKWECIGGSFAYAVVDTQESTTSAAYVDLATVGPSITCPRSGVYVVGFGAAKGFTSNLNNEIMSFSNGGTAASDTDAAFAQGFDTGSGAAFGCLTTERRVTVAAAGDIIRSKYRINVAGGGNTANFAGRWLRVMPVRVS